MVLFTFRFTLLCSLVMLLPPVHAPAQTTGSLTVQMRGMRNDAGLMRVALFNETAPFPSDKPVFGASVAIRHGEAIAEFHNVPFGYYAISAFHDENNNAKLDLSIFGPIERYGFSNGARGLFAPPGFDKAKIMFNEKHHVFVIEVK